MTMMIDPYRFVQADSGLYVPTPFLIAERRSSKYTFATSASDTQGVLTEDATWEETDYLVFSVVCKDVSVNTPTGLELLDELQHPTNSALRCRIFGGFKGANTSWTFDFSAGGGFVILGMALTNIDADDPVYSINLTSMVSASPTRDIQIPTTEIDEEGLVVVPIVGADDTDISNDHGAVWRPRQPSNTYVWMTGPAVLSTAIAAYNQAEHNTRVVPPARKVTGSVSTAVMGTLLLRRASGERPTLEPDFSGLESYLSGAAVGYAWIAIKDNEIVDSNAGGLARGTDTGTNPSQAFTLNTHTPIASISKLITEIGIRKLITDGVLSMDDTVADWMSSYTLGTNVGNITVRQLLQMTSGITASFALDGAHPSTMMSWIQNTSTNRGEWYNYQNGNFAILQTIMEEATGVPYADWIEENVFDPLGIEGFTTTPDTTNGVRMYSGTIPSGGADPFVVPATAVAGWCLPFSELTKLARELRTPVVLSSQSLEEMLKDRYRLIADYTRRGEQHFHDGALSLSSDGMRVIMMRGTDGYDLIATVNTYVTYSDLHNAMRDCLQ